MLKGRRSLFHFSEKSIFSSWWGFLHWKQIARYIVLNTHYFMCSKYLQMSVLSCQLCYRKRVDNPKQEESQVTKVFPMLSSVSRVTQWPLRVVCSWLCKPITREIWTLSGFKNNCTRNWGLIFSSKYGASSFMVISDLQKLKMEEREGRREKYILQ